MRRWLRFFERRLRRFENHPYLLAAAGGAALVILYTVAGPTYGGLGTDTITGALTGSISIFEGALLLKRKGSLTERVHQLRRFRRR